jgi:hypothetical protein
VRHTHGRLIGLTHATERVEFLIFAANGLSGHLSFDSRNLYQSLSMWAPFSRSLVLAGVFSYKKQYQMPLF